jgi:predicted site-specific integrase-resolvase
MRGNETRLYKISEACEIIGVKPGILRKWDQDGHIKAIRTPGGMRLFDISSIDPIINISRIKKKEDPCVILYSRVSSHKQKDDLERQREFLKQNLPDKYSGSTINNMSDVGSGINFKRPGLLQILGLVKEGKVSTVVVASRDRLARFGFELIEWMCTEFGTQILVLDSQDTTPESELGEDLMAIVQVYCCRWNGRRRYKNENKKDQGDEAKTEAKQGTERAIEQLGGMCEISLQQDDCPPDESQKQDDKREVPAPTQAGTNQKPNNKTGKQFLCKQALVEKMPKQHQKRSNL